MFSLSFIAFLFALLLSDKPAYGYANPGSSLVLLQGFSSVIMGAIYFFRAKIASFFRRTKAEERGQESH